MADNNFDLHPDRKVEAKLLAWLAKGAARNGCSQPVLQGVLIMQASGRGEPTAVTCDGVQLRAVQCREHTPGVFSLETHEAMECKYPDVAAVIPRGTPHKTVTFNLKLLRSIIAGMDGRVTLVFRDDGRPVELHGTVAGTPVYALLTPMVADPGPFWNPFPGNGER